MHRELGRWQGFPRLSFAWTLQTIVSVVLAVFATGGTALGQNGAGEPFFSTDEFIGEDGQTGDDIYRNVVANRFDAFEQIGRMRSGSRNQRFLLTDPHSRLFEY